MPPGGDKREQERAPIHFSSLAVDDKAANRKKMEGQNTREEVRETSTACQDAGKELQDVSRGRRTTVVTRAYRAGSNEEKRAGEKKTAH